MGVVRGIWDKKQTKMFAMCEKLRDQKIVDDTLGGGGSNFIVLQTPLPQLVGAY